jgi:uridine kinase
MTRVILGIGGGTGSGKTTAARKIIDSMGEANAVYLPQDSYYRNLDDMPLDRRSRVNFDHPDAFDTELLLEHLDALRAGRSIEQPLYDFASHTRKKETLHVEPLPLVVAEGILVFWDARMRSRMDLKVFVDCDPDMRFVRRLERDMRERGRSVESVIEQYMTTVRPMHQEFVEPAKRYADIILREGGLNESGLDIIIGKVRTMLMRNR